jgi:hypothetical protein
MITAALLQQPTDSYGEPEIHALAEELSRRSIPFQFFPEKKMRRAQLPLSPSTLVAGHIPVVLSALKQLGRPAPAIDDYPDILRPFLHRRIWKSTVADIITTLQNETTTPFFAKPLGRTKRFPGHVFASWEDMRHLRNASDHLPVICSQVVSFQSEFRAFVTHHQLTGIRHYLGNPSLTPDPSVISAALAAYTSTGNAPAGFAADFGVLSTGQTALIELNDGFSLGSYNLPAPLYTNLLLARWTEMCGNSASQTPPS